MRGWAVAATAVVLACGGADRAADVDGRPTGSESLRVFHGARVWDGVGGQPVAATLVVGENGRVRALIPAGEESTAIDAAEGATVDSVDLSGLFVVPGLVNAHGHVGDVLGLEGGHYDRANLERQLRLYARYGVTTVVSLGGDGPEGVALRDEQERGDLDRARLFVAGEVVADTTAEGAVRTVDRNASLGADFVKFRVDDNLGTGRKMPRNAYLAAIERGHELGRTVTTHVFYLEDAKQLLRDGTDFIAHSVRDRLVDDEFVRLLMERGVCYSPTLTREVSTFAYRGEPDFFADSFFLLEADPGVLDQLRDPDRQARVRENPASAAYEAALTVALENLRALSGVGVRIAFGTDTGPAGRFQGYFEHMELELMAGAGMGPRQILRAATSEAAACLGLEGVGTLEPGGWADFVAVRQDPFGDIRALRSIESVWVAGNPVGSPGHPAG